MSKNKQLKDGITTWQIVMTVIYSVYVGYMWHIGNEALVVTLSFATIFAMAMKQTNQINKQ